MSENKVTEDGLIEKALRVMGSRPSEHSNKWILRRVDHEVWCGELLSSDPRPWAVALFIHEAKLYLREKGFNEVRVYEEINFGHDCARPPEQKWYLSATSWPKSDGDDEDEVEGTGPTEHEAYAQAVLAASGIEPTISEPEAPSTTSHQTENPSPVSSTKTEGEE